MSRKNLDKAICINPKVPPCYGHIQNKAGSYSTVVLRLDDTNFLMNSAEGYRRSQRLEPFFEWDRDSGEYFIYGEYEFWAELNNKPDNHIELQLRYVAIPECEYLNEGSSTYTRSIRLTTTEQDTLLKIIDKQCVHLFGKSCAQLLNEARARFSKEKKYGVSNGAIKLST